MANLQYLCALSASVFQRLVERIMMACWIIKRCVVFGMIAWCVVLQSNMNAQSWQSKADAYVVRRGGDGDESLHESPYERKFQKIWHAVEEQFYDPELHGVDWKKIKETYHARLAFIKSKSDFETLMNQILAELHASHTAYVTVDDVEFYMLHSVRLQDMQRYQVEHIGIMGQREGKEYVVNGVLDDGPAAKAGIQAGDHLLLADGQPFTSAGSFQGKAGTSVSVELKRADEVKSRVVSVVPIRKNMLRSYLDATIRSARIIEAGNKKIGYIHLWTMAQDAFRSTLETLVLTKLHDTDGLILDLRDGYGGHPFGYSDVFFRPDVSWESNFHDGKKTMQHTGYAKPIVVLINDGTRSAKEFLTYQMKVSHRATIVGTQTAGAFLGAGFVPIYDDGLLEMAEVGLKLDGNKLERNGVKPDVVVPSKFAYREQDAQIARAKQILLHTRPDQAPETNGAIDLPVH